MSAKHTPGPWQSQHDFDLAGEYTIVGNIDGEIIDGHTHHSFTLVAEVYDNDNLSEGRANSRLIAAAPELLEALELLIADFVDYPASERPCLAFDKARVAIAKARGEASE